MTNAIANDTLQGLPQIGTDLGSFLTNLAPGVGAFLIVIAILGGIAGIIAGIVMVIKKRINFR